MKKIIFALIVFVSVFFGFTLKGNAYSRNDLRTYFSYSNISENELFTSANISTEYIGTSPSRLILNSRYDSTHYVWSRSIAPNESLVINFRNLIYGSTEEMMTNVVYFAFTLDPSSNAYTDSIDILMLYNNNENLTFSKGNAQLVFGNTIYIPIYFEKADYTEHKLKELTIKLQNSVSIVLDFSIVSMKFEDRNNFDYYSYVCFTDNNTFIYPQFFNVPLSLEEEYSKGYQAGYQAGYNKGLSEGQQAALEGKNSFSDSVVNIFNNSPSTGKWHEGKVLSQSLNVSNSIDFTTYYDLNPTLESGTNLSTLFVQFSTGFYIYPRDISFIWNKKDFSPENVVLQFYSGDSLTLSLGSVYVPFDSNTNTFSFQLEDTRQLSRLDTISISFYKVDDLNAAQYPLSMKVVASQFSLGYQAGYEESDKFHKNEYDKGLNAGYDKGFQEGYESGHNAGYNKGSKDSLNKTGLPGFFSLIVQYPIDFFKAIFNFEIMGINLFGLITFILSVGLAVYVWRRFK